MRKRASYLSLSLILSFFIYTSFALALMLSLPLQKSYASKKSIDEEITDQPSKMRKVLACSKNSQTCYGALNILPEDILTFHILPKCNNNIIKVNRSFFMLITGYNCEHIFDQGFKNRPTRPVCHIMSNTSINFESLSQDIDQIPSFIWYSLVRHVKNMPSNYWSYLKESHIEIIELRQSQLSDDDAHVLGQSLQGTQVQTLDLGWNQIGDDGVQALGQSMKGAQVQYIDLSANQIGDEGAHILGQSLQGSQVQILNLSWNQISKIGEQNLRLILKDTQVDTLIIQGSE